MLYFCSPHNKTPFCISHNSLFWGNEHSSIIVCKSLVSKCSSGLTSPQRAKLYYPDADKFNMYWDPYTANLCSEIKKVLWQLSSKIRDIALYNFESKTLTKHLAVLSWQTLKQHQTASFLIYFNQALYSLSALPIDNPTTPTHKTCHMHTKHLMVPFAHTNVFKFSFVSHSIVAWNSLPQSLIIFESKQQC